MIVEMLVLIYYATSTIKLFTPMSGQDRISPYNINTVSSRQVMRIKKKLTRGLYNLIQYQIPQVTSQELYGRQ